MRSLKKFLQGSCCKWMTRELLKTCLQGKRYSLLRDLIMPMQCQERRGCRTLRQTLARRNPVCTVHTKKKWPHR